MVKKKKIKIAYRGSGEKAFKTRPTYGRAKIAVEWEAKKKTKTLPIKNVKHLNPNKPSGCVDPPSKCATSHQVCGFVLLLPLWTHYTETDILWGYPRSLITNPSLWEHKILMCRISSTGTSNDVKIQTIKLFLKL